MEIPSSVRKYDYDETDLKIKQLYTNKPGLRATVHVACFIYDDFILIRSDTAATSLPNNRALGVTKSRAPRAGWCWYGRKHVMVTGAQTMITVGFHPKSMEFMAKTTLC